MTHHVRIQRNNDIIHAIHHHNTNGDQGDHHPYPPSFFHIRMKRSPLIDLSLSKNKTTCVSIMVGENYMWISEGKTLDDLDVAAKDPSVSCLYFVHVNFTEAVTDQLCAFRGRRFGRIVLMSCRGKLDLVMSILFEELQVEALRIDSLRFKPSTAKALGKGLAQSRYLKSLSFQAMSMTETLAESLKHGLAQTRNLETLLWNTITAPQGVKWVNHILEAIQKNSSLKRLGIYRVKNLCSAQVLHSIQNHSTLQHLAMTLQDLKPSTLKALENLANSSQSKLCTMKLCIRGEWQRITCLPSGRVRFSLEISTTRYKNMRILGKALAENDSIESLSLGYNGFADENITILSSWLRKAKGLKHLNLNGNSLETEGSQALISALQSNHQLERVELPIRCEHTDQICHLVDLNRGGRRLLLDTNAPSSLWPHAMDRAGSIDYSEYPLHTNSKENDRRRANVVYHLLHGPALLHRQGESSVSPTP
jgi:hypothetical protein